MSTSQAHQPEVLRQAAAALQGRRVTLWEVASPHEAPPVATSAPHAAPQDIQLDLNATVGRWGIPIVRGSRWVGCKLEYDGRWCVAPVRMRPADPPPGGVERRSPERIILELTGLCIGLLDAANDAGKRRLPPEEALLEHARQPSVIAHEVGNPLAAALGNLDFGISAVRAATALDPTFRSQLLQDLRNAAEGIDQATQYLRSIQDRPPVGSAKYVRFDVTPVLQSCVTLERPLARRRGVELTWKCTVDSTFIYGDANGLYQIATNLIRNAVDASAGGSEPVLVALDRVGETLHLTVADRGVGIAAPDLEKIFVAGFTTKAPGAGTGTGLAVVRELVQDMFGGTVRVDSELGTGSTFVVMLPIPPQRSPRTS
ncbi:MAG TPA: HAMP domain-containing sensor histidine kinase [Gemmatimonadales bacterium]